MRIVFEKVPDSEGSSFGCFHAGGRGFDCPYHVHPEVEILHILSGRGQLVVGDHLGRFAPGDLLLIGGGLPHMLCSDSPDAENAEPTHLRYIQFKRENFGEAFWRMPEQAAASALLEKSSRGLHLSEESAAGLLPAMDRLWETSGARRLWSLMRFLEETAASSSMRPLASLGYASLVTHRDSERLDRAIQYMRGHLTEKLSLAAVASEAGFSPPAFSRFFHRSMGLSFVDYVTSLRLSLACRTLLETDKSVAEVCYASGFNNLSNFNRQFLRHKKTTPREFQKNGRFESRNDDFSTRIVPQAADSEAWPAGL